MQGIVNHVPTTVLTRFDTCVGDVSGGPAFFRSSVTCAHACFDMFWDATCGMPLCTQLCISFLQLFGHVCAQAGGGSW